MYAITCIKNIIFIYIIFYLRWVNSYTSKEEVLRTKNEYYVRYYCKDDICARVNSYYDKLFIKLPDKNGTEIKYIVYTCTQETIDSGNCMNSTFYASKEYSVECNDDSECLSNKCYKNHCMFNDETPIVHCDDIYSYKWYSGSSSYMHCGKSPEDNCQEDDECSSKNCGGNLCQYQDEGPSDSDGIINGIGGLILMGVLIITVTISIVIIICCCCCK